MPIKVGMVSLGCSKNQVDAERMLYKIKDAGYQLSADAALADVVIINTCGFIQSAKEEAIETILEFAQLKKEGRIQKIIVSGCLAERYREEVANEIPEADAVIGIGCNEDICGVIDKALANRRVVDFADKKDLSLEGGRVLTTLPYFSYLKVAEGCDNRCTYCAIPSIRGGFRSRPMEEIIKEAQGLAEQGVRELNVIAQDTTRYGEDVYGKLMLPALLTELCKIEKLKWIRVLYCYPERVTDELLDVMAREEKIVKYMDLPLQHVNGEVLKRMNRRGDAVGLKALLKKIREKIPDVTLRTTLITGFPGETEEQYAEMEQFVREVRFDRLGCFAYSAEDGTPAAEMAEQLDDEVKQRRADHIMEVQMGISEENNQKMLGKTVEVVAEGFDRYAECYYGRTAADAPDIDGKIFFTAKKRPYSGQFLTVRVTDTMDYDLIGEVLDESAE